MCVWNEKIHLITEEDTSRYHHQSLNINTNKNLLFYCLWFVSICSLVIFRLPLVSALLIQNKSRNWITTTKNPIVVDFFYWKLFSSSYTRVNLWLGNIFFCPWKHLDWPNVMLTLEQQVYAKVTQIMWTVQTVFLITTKDNVTETAWKTSHYVFIGVSKVCPFKHFIFLLALFLVCGVDISFLVCFLEFKFRFAIAENKKKYMVPHSNQFWRNNID